MTTGRTERTGDFEEAIRAAGESSQARMWTALPGIVTAVDLAKQTVSVQPAIKGQVTSQDGEQQAVNMPLCVDVPIVWPRAGGFALTFPVAVGDELLVVFASRCIDSWWQSGGVQEMAELRMHDLSDGFAILAPTSQPKVLASVSAANVQLRSELGTTYLEITPTGIINVVSPTSINFTAPVFSVTAAAINLTGLLTQIGNVISTGTMKNNDHDIGSEHKHEDVQSGTGLTGVVYKP